MNGVELFNFSVLIRFGQGINSEDSSELVKSNGNDDDKKEMEIVGLDHDSGFSKHL